MHGDSTPVGRRRATRRRGRRGLGRGHGSPGAAGDGRRHAGGRMGRRPRAPAPSRPETRAPAGAAPLDPENEAPERVDVRYASRMPEAKMQRLIDGVVVLTEQTLQRARFGFGFSWPMESGRSGGGWTSSPCSPISCPFWTSITPPTICPKRRSICSARPRAKPITGLHRGATNCAMKRGRRIVCCARWPITGANSRRARNAMAR